MTPNTDLVIPIHGTREFPVEDLLEKCVASVCAYTTNFRFIFVSDACDHECSARISDIASRYTECLLVRTHKQHWFTRAANTGLRLVRTPYAVLMNCDLTVGEGWLEELYAVKDEVEKTEGRVGLVGSEMSGEEPRRYDIIRHPGYVTGHCILFSMQAMLEASHAHSTPGFYFDETRADCIHIRSDVNICYELNHLGWLTARSFKAAVGHLGGRSWGHQIGRIPGSLEAVNYRY